MTLCAECGVISQLHLTGGGRLTHFVCVNGDSEVIMPCRRCRQLLFEHGGPDLLLLTVSGVRTMAGPADAFGLPTRRPAAPVLPATSVRADDDLEERRRMAGTTRSR